MNDISIFLWVGGDLLGDEDTIKEFSLILLSDFADLVNS